MSGDTLGQEVKSSSWETHLGGRGAESRPSSHRICCTRWSRAARTRPPAPRLKRWSAPPCSRQTVASPPQEVSQTGTRVGSGCRWSVGSLETMRRGGIILEEKRNTVKIMISVFFQLNKMEAGLVNYNSSVIIWTMTRWLPICLRTSTTNQQ